MNRALILQTNELTNPQVVDLIQYSVIVKGKANICSHDITNRPINQQWILVYSNKEFDLIDSASFGELSKNNQLVMAKDNYDFFNLLINEFKYE